MIKFIHSNLHFKYMENSCTIITDSNIIDHSTMTQHLIVYSGSFLNNIAQQLQQQVLLSGGDIMQQILTICNMQGAKWNERCGPLSSLCPYFQIANKKKDNGNNLFTRILVVMLNTSLVYALTLWNTLGCTPWISTSFHKFLVINSEQQMTQKSCSPQNNLCDFVVRTFSSFPSLHLHILAYSC